MGGFLVVTSQPVNKTGPGESQRAAPRAVAITQVNESSFGLQTGLL
jgi:hypothetical protein